VIANKSITYSNFSVKVLSLFILCRDQIGAGKCPVQGSVPGGEVSLTIRLLGSVTRDFVKRGSVTRGSTIAPKLDSSIVAINF
jgi:hypothetical protein